jgi:uncharacterized oxidoreductase
LGRPAASLIAGQIFVRFRSMKISNNKILITGGATGIGYGLAERFVREGNTVIICGRRESALQEAAASLPGIITRVCDLGSEPERIALYEWVQAEHPDLTVLLNNAGIQNWMSPADDDFYARAKAEVEINALAPLHLASLFTKLDGLQTIINVSSGLAFVPLAKVPVYCATKAFLRSFTLSLRRLMKDRSIEVIELIPPALNTDLGAPGIHDGAPAVSEFIESVFEQLKAGATEATFGTSADRARANNSVIAEYFQRMNP